MNSSMSFLIRFFILPYPRHDRLLHRLLGYILLLPSETFEKCSTWLKFSAIFLDFNHGGAFVAINLLSIAHPAVDGHDHADNLGDPFKHRNRFGLRTRVWPWGQFFRG